MSDFVSSIKILLNDPKLQFKSFEEAGLEVKKQSSSAATSDRQTQDSSNARSMLLNLESLSSLLKSDFATFISNVMYNQSFNTFMKSYIQNRPKFTSISSSNGYPYSPDFEDIDRKTIQLVHRLLFDDYEAHLAPHIKKPLTKGNQSVPITELYVKALQLVPFWNTRLLITLVAIWGDANAAISGAILLQFIRLMGICYQKEFSYEIDLFVKRVRDIRSEYKTVQAQHQKTTFRNSSNQQAKQSSVGNQLTSHSETAHGIARILRELLDQIYKFKCYFNASSQSEKSQLVSDNTAYHPLGSLYTGRLSGLSKSGSHLLSSLGMIYDGILPLIDSIANIQLIRDGGKEGSWLVQQRLQMTAIRVCILATVDRLINISIPTLQLISFPCPLRQEAASAWLADQSLSWYDWFQDSLTGGSISDEQSSCSLGADIIRSVGDAARFVIQISAEDSQKAAYLLDSLSQVHGYLVSSNSRDDSGETSSYRQSSFESLINNSLQVSVVHRNAIDINLNHPAVSKVSIAVNAIKGIFPDYGAIFIISCLKAFNMDVDETVNALLSENLPPNLARMDRTLEQVSIGKSSLKTAFNEKANNSFLSMQKERIRAQEREEAEDSRVLLEEYNDDYDDQYDDIVAIGINSGGFRDAPSDQIMAAKHQPIDLVVNSANGSTILSKKEARKAGVSARVSSTPAINWDVKMKDMKRLNSLIKSAEEEGKFWAEMRNTNKDHIRNDDPMDDHDNDDEDEVENIDGAAGRGGRGSSSRGRGFGGRGNDGGRGNGSKRNNGQSRGKAFHDRQRSLAGSNSNSSNSSSKT